MKVVSINGSPRVNGNLAKLITELSKAVAENNGDMSLFDVNSMNVKGCQACMACRKLDYCVINDDMKILYDNIDESDVLVLGMPIYFHEMSAQLKLVLDRFYAYQRMSSDFKFSSTLKKGKKVVLVVSYANPNKKIYNDYINSVEQRLLALGFEEVSVFTASDSEGDHPEYLESCYEIGKCL